MPHDYTLHDSERLSSSDYYYY